MFDSRSSSECVETIWLYDVREIVEMTISASLFDDMGMGRPRVMLWMWDSQEEVLEDSGVTSAPVSSKTYTQWHRLLIPSLHMSVFLGRLQEQAAFFGVFGSLMDKSTGALEVLYEEGRIPRGYPEGLGSINGRDPSTSEDVVDDGGKDDKKRKREKKDKKDKKEKKKEKRERDKISGVCG